MYNVYECILGGINMMGKLKNFIKKIKKLKINDKRILIVTVIKDLYIIVMIYMMLVVLRFILSTHQQMI